MSQNSGEAIRFAGDVSIRKVQIVTSSANRVDVTNQIIGIEVYEDMFSPFISIAISVRESLDFINALPLRGEELVKLEIATPTFKDDFKVIKGTFYIYKLSDRQLLTDRNSVYTLHCVSYEALTDLNMKQSRAYNGNIAQIVKTILGKDALNTNKRSNIENTKNSTKYVSNFWSPIKNINYVACTALNKNDSPTFIFFENREGFNFVSLDTLYEQKTYQKFIKDNYARDTDKQGKNSMNLERDYQRIMEVKVNVSFDALKFMNNGAYSSRMYAYDLVKKKYFAKDYNYLADFQDMNHLNKFAPYTDAKPVSPANLIFNEIRHYASHDGYPDTSNIASQQKRNSMLQVLRSNIIEITVFGRTDYTVGQKVYVELPKPTVITKEDQANTDDKKGIIDSTYSGNYIVTAINHVINRDSHTCIMELSKESLMA
jgi:hypothetical protein